MSEELKTKILIGVSIVTWLGLVVALFYFKVHHTGAL